MSEPKRAPRPRGKPTRSRVVAFLPGVSAGEVESALGAPVVWCGSVSELLAALAPGGWSVALVSFDHESVNETLLVRLAATEKRGALFLTGRVTSVDRVIAAERAGAVALLVDFARLPIYMWGEGANVALIWPLVAVATLGVVAGTFAGGWLLARIPEPIFRRAVGALVFVLGLAVLVRGRM